MMLGHTLALDPDDVQEAYFCKAAGTARFALTGPIPVLERNRTAFWADTTRAGKGAPLFKAS